MHAGIGVADDIAGIFLRSSKLMSIVMLCTLAPRIFQKTSTVQRRLLLVPLLCDCCEGDTEPRVPCWNKTSLTVFLTYMIGTHPHHYRRTQAVRSRQRPTGLEMSLAGAHGEMFQQRPSQEWDKQVHSSTGELGTLARPSPPVATCRCTPVDQDTGPILSCSIWVAIGP